MKISFLIGSVVGGAVQRHPFSGGNNDRNNGRTSQCVYRDSINGAIKYLFNKITEFTHTSCKPIDHYKMCTHTNTCAHIVYYIIIVFVRR